MRYFQAVRSRSDWKRLKAPSPALEALARPSVCSECSIFVLEDILANHKSRSKRLRYSSREPVLTENSW
jgi:hypothetical protein